MQSQRFWFQATKGILRIGITVAVAIAAGLLAYKLWVRYTDYPWTRDGRVRADVVNIAPDVKIRL